MLPALSRGDFDRVVDFSVTLKTLAAAAEGRTPLPTGRMLLLSGTVSDVTILNKDQATFKVRIELITGEWIGLEDVKAYACYVEFSGPEFFKVFPIRAPRTAARMRSPSTRASSWSAARLISWTPPRGRSTCARRAPISGPSSSGLSAASWCTVFSRKSRRGR